MNQYKMYKLVIEGRLSGCNEYINACRRNRYLGAKVKKEAQEQIKPYIKEQLQDVHIYGRATIHFHWVEPNGRRDLDNIAWSKKFILDALVDNEIIPDDSQKYICGFTDSFSVDKDRPRIEVEIEEY